MTANCGEAHGQLVRAVPDAEAERSDAGRDTRPM